MARSKPIPTVIKHASYSKLLDFEACPLRAKMKHLDRVPTSPSPAADRGTSIHNMAEMYVNGTIPHLPVELAMFAEEFKVLRKEYTAGNVSLEGAWGFDENWLPCSFEAAWLRMKLDFRLHRRAKQQSIVGDYKTGRRHGNELKHGEQVHIYAVGECLREPWVQTITVELWYLDIDDLVTTTYTREQAMRFLPSFEKRLLKMTQATEFPPRANVYTCRWCDYGPNKGRQCEHGVTENVVSIANYRKRYG